MIASAPTETRVGSAQELILADLLNDVTTLAPLIVTEVRRRSWLDAFLLAAGVNQVVEDWLHRDILSSRKMAGVLARRGGSGRAGARLVLQLRAAALRVRRRRRSDLRAARWQRDVARLVDELARTVAGTHPPANDLLELAERVAVGVNRLPVGLTASILRLPSCFRSLDQRPEDCAELARLFAERWPDRDRPLQVIGLRTSGSYLAPLQAAYLSGLGYPVRHCTLRPGQDLLGDEGSILEGAARAGLVLICDDPPDSGAALAQAAAQLEAVGVDLGNLVLLLALMEELPARLRGYQVVALPPEHWRIRRLLEPEAVRTALGAQSVDPVEHWVRCDLKTDSGGRSHLRAVYRVTRHDGSEQLVYTKGVGLGYFGRHTEAVSRAMGEYLPRTLGLVDGVLFREWLPEAARLASPPAASTRAIAERIAGYVADRADRLPAAADRSLALTDRHPLWQRVADRLGRGFRGLRPLARPALHRLSRRLLTAHHPSVVDGSLSLTQWFAHPASGDLRKVDYDERAFSNEDLHVYDAAWDLAVAAADAEMEGASPLAGELRAAYERRTGRSIEDVRWLLYRVQYLAGFADALAELAGQGRHDQAAALAMRCRAVQAAEGVLLKHLAGLLLGDLAGPASGRLCAIDVDGVLETSWLGISSITPNGLLALRGLSVHGYRPVLVSGRSLPEMMLRCRELRLAGAVAEYGAVACRARDGTRSELLEARQRQALERLRRDLQRRPGVFLDPRWERTVRAYRLDAGGNRRGLQRDEVEAVLADAGAELRAEPGWAQTDFVATGIDKADGVAALLELVAPEVAGMDHPLALAVGDTEPDLPVMRLAERRWAPANVNPALRAAGVRVARSRFQAGLAEAVADLIGHRPGGCSECRLPELPHDDRLLLQALAAQDAGPWARLVLGWRLYREAGR